MEQGKYKIDGTHWVTRGWPFFHPNDFYGFIYRVTFLLTGEQYIGKKSFWKMNKSGTKRLGPSKWECYTSSSEHLNALIDEYGKECFEFEILLLCRTKAVCSYGEQNFLHKLDALTRVDSTWGLPVYLNKHIDAVRWITKDYPIDAVNSIVEVLKNETL